jgi:DNA-binding PadR family transcriptional regulator
VTTADGILGYLAHRPALLGHLTSSLNTSEPEILEAVDELKRKAWVQEATAWYGDDTGNAVTIYTLTPEGRREAARREEVEDETTEPHEVTRDQLVAELKRRFEWSDEQILGNPTLRASRYWYWPSVGAFAAKPDS